MPRKKRRITAYERQIGFRLNRLRRELKPAATIAELAGQARVTAATWQNWESAKCGFPDHQKPVVCRILGCDVLDLVDPHKSRVTWLDAPPD